MKNLAILIVIVFTFFTLGAQPVQKIPMKKYLEFARSAADWTWEKYDSLEKVWISSVDPTNIFGYRPPSRYLDAATIYATLYEIEGNRKYAERARTILLKYTYTFTL